MVAIIARNVSTSGAALRFFIGSLAIALAAATTVCAAEGDSLDAALVGAVSKGDAAATRQLLGEGADPHAASAKGVPVLTMASVKGFAEVAELLMDFGADVDRSSKISTALMNAVTMQREKAVRALLAGGADVRLAVRTGDTALHYAAKRKSAAIVGALVDAGAGLNAANGEGITPLMFAAMHGQEASVARLLAAGADVHLKDKVRKTALDHARAKGRTKVVKQIEQAIAARETPIPGRTIRPAAGADLEKITQNAAGGQMIVLGPGVYFGPIVVRKIRLTVQGDPRGRTVIASKPGGKNSLVYVASGGDLVLSGVGFKGIPAGRPAVFVVGAKASLTRCRFKAPPSLACYVEKGQLTVDDSAFSGLPKAGVLAIDQAFVVIKNSTFTDCKTTALLAQNQSGIIVSGCTFDRIGGSAVSGIKATNVTLRDSKVSGCSGAAVSVQGAAKLTVLGNRITKCGWGVLARQVAEVLVQRNAITNATPKGCGVQATDSPRVRICDNRIVNVHSAINVRGALKSPAAIARNTVVNSGDGAIFVRTRGPQGRPGALITRNDCVQFGNWGIMLSQGSRGIIVRNTVVSATGMGLAVQRKSEAILNGNLIQTPETTVNIYKSPAKKIWLRREILVGPDSRSIAQARSMATARRIKTALSFSENSGRIRNAVSSLLAQKDGTTPDGVRKLYGALSALHAARAQVWRAASELTAVRLLVEDTIGQRRPRGFSVYDGASPILYGSPAFFSTSIKQPQRILIDVKEKKTGLSAYLRTTSSAETQRLLKDYNGQAPPSRALVEALVKEFNRLVTGAPMYDKERFEGVHLDAKTQDLIKGVAGIKKEDLGKPGNRRLIDRHNRLLIEAAYGDWIAKSEKLAAATLAERWAFLRPGMYWVVSDPEARYRRRVGVKAGGPVDVLAKSTTGLWLKFRRYEGGPLVWHMFVPRSKAKMRQMLSWLRRTYEDAQSFSLHRPGASRKDVVLARQMALKALPFAGGPSRKGDEPYLRETTRYYVRRILAIAGEPEDARKIIQSYKPHKGASAEFSAKNGWACTIARLEARHGRLEKGALVSLLKGDDKEWALAAAIHLHKQGLTVGDDLLREYIRAPSFRYTTATPSHVLLDSDDPRTLDAMRALMRFTLAKHREWVAKHKEWAGKDKERPTWLDSPENSSVPAALYLLAYGDDADAKLVSSAELGQTHIYYLSFISRDPLYFAGVLTNSGSTQYALRLGTGFLDRSPAESRTMYLMLVYGIAKRRAQRVGRRRDPRYGSPVSRSLNSSNVFCSYYMPNRTIITFYGKFGRVTPYEPEMVNQRGFLQANSFAETPWVVETKFLDRYVDYWLKGYEDFNMQLEYIDNAAIAKAVAARGKGKTPLAFDLFLAAHRVSTRAYWHAWDHCPMGLARRPYVLRYRDKTSGGISGVSAMRYEWMDNRLRIGIRFRQEALYHAGSFIDRSNRREYQHHKYLLDHGRALIQSVTLTKGQQTVVAKDSGRVDDDGFIIFEAPMKSADPAGWAMTVHMQFVKQKFDFSYNLYTDDSARRHRHAVEAVSLAKAALAGKPNDAGALIALARAQRTASELTDAWRTYRAALRQQPDNMDLWDEAREAFASKGLRKQAAEVASLAVKQKPKDVERHARLVRALFEARLYKAGAVAVAEALKLGPEGKEGWQWARARCLLLDSQYRAANEALGGLEGTVGETTLSVFRYIAARSSKGAIEPGPATKALRSLYDKLKKDPPARHQIGILLGTVGAGSAFQHAKGKAAMCRAHCYLGYQYLFAGDKERAAEQFRHALRTRQADQFEFRLAEVEIQRLP